MTTQEADARQTTDLTRKIISHGTKCCFCHAGVLATAAGAWDIGAGAAHDTRDAVEDSVATSVQDPASAAVLLCYQHSYQQSCNWPSC